MSKDLSSGPVVPAQLNYSSALPVAIESRSQRRHYFPSNGDVFGPSKINQVRFNINSDNMVDFTHSYFAMTLENSAAAGKNLAPDVGVPWISRIQISSGGQDLEDINEYARLHAMMLQLQGSLQNLPEWTNTYNTRQQNVLAAADITAGDFVGTHNAGGITYTPANAGEATATNNALNAVIEAKIIDGVSQMNQAQVSLVHNSSTGDATSGNIAPSQKRTYNFPVISAIFNLTKYFPLVLTSQGLDVIFHLAPAVQIGAWTHNATVPDYTITNCRFVSHEVSLDATFYDRLRSSVASSSGVLTLAGETFRHYLNTTPGGAAGPHSLNISARVKSLKALLSRCTESNATNEDDVFSLGVGQATAKSYQYRIGSVLYPQTKIKTGGDAGDASYAGTSEVTQEIRKCFGVIGDYTHGSLLTKTSQENLPGAATIAAAGANETPNSTMPRQAESCQLATLAYDFQSFSKTATESGLNLSDRALSVTMDIETNPSYNRANGAAAVASPQRIDTFAVCDCMIYIGIDGSVTTRI